MLPPPQHTAVTSKPLGGLRWVMPCQSLGLPQREVWSEYRVINKPAQIATAADTMKEEADCRQTALATRVN